MSNSRLNYQFDGRTDIENNICVCVRMCDLFCSVVCHRLPLVWSVEPLIRFCLGNQIIYTTGLNLWNLPI